MKRQEDTFMAGNDLYAFSEQEQPRSLPPVSMSDLEDEDETTQLLLQHRYLSECMGGVLPATLDLSEVRRVLDVQCGTGGWMYELAWNHPSIQVMGIDGHPAYVEKAQELVSMLGNATVVQQDIRRLSDEAVTPASFDLVHTRFLVSVLSPQEYPTVLTALVRRCRKGGLFAWDELEYPITSSPACQAFYVLMQDRLKAAGRAFSPGNPLGITAMMSSFLQEAGCKTTLDAACAIEISSGTRGRDIFAWQMWQVSRLLRSFLLDAGIVTEAFYDELCSQMQREISQDNFFGLIYVRTSIGTRII